MKRLSIKLKVTLWFTLMMTLIVSAALSFLITVGERIVSEQINVKLTDAVNDSFSEIKYRFGELDIDDDLDFYNEGVYIAVYDTEGKLLYGRLPSGFDRTISFSAGEIRTVNEGEHAQYILDAIHDAGDEHEVIVRGVLSATGSESAFEAIVELAMIMFPILTVVAAVIGYLLAKRAFKPVKQIADAAETISNGNDLSKRIGLSDGKDEIHQLAQEFDMMFDRLQESFENEKRFTSDASHELRTPLAVIIAQCEDVLSGNMNENETREAIETVLEKAKGMSSLLSSLLTLARADRGHLKLVKEKIDLSAICGIVAEQTKDFAEEKNISVFSDIEQNVFINGDETMLIRMMLNLCENGIKYGKQNGFLKIRLKHEGEKAVCEIEDNGIGIAKQNIDKVWERFFREDEARTSGSGLGLPLAKYIAEAHGGSISLESEQGKGSIFRFELPMQL